MVKVKVCGITNIDDAIRSVELGADFLGFNFYPPSPRYVSPEKAQAIASEAPPEVGKVALFVNEQNEKIHRIIDGRSFSGVQFHGEESAEFCRGWRVTVIKAFRVRDRESLAVIDGFPADYYLVDSWAPGYGGSGAPFPWSWLEGLRADRLILAGGLDAGNVAEAIRLVRPYGVDVCTGVEARPGIKDHEKLKAFIDAAKSA